MVSSDVNGDCDEWIERGPVIETWFFGRNRRLSKKRRDFGERKVSTVTISGAYWAGRGVRRELADVGWGPVEAPNQPARRDQHRRDQYCEQQKD
jgi:hypothetical protein